MKTIRRGLLGCLPLLASACAGQIAQAPAEHTHSPAAAVEELLAADRALAAASATTDLVAGLSAMFDAEVIMPIPGNTFARGKEAAVRALQSNPENVRSRIEWTPIRGGISGDGLHGFTFGYMTLHRPDGPPAPLKYLAYWIKRPEGWRVVGYKRRPAAAGEISREPMPPSLPPRLVPPSGDSAVLARHRASLDAAERAFSGDAQRIGLGAAFTHYGHADAMNMGGPNHAGFVIGAEAIGRSVGAGTPTDSSPVWWEPEEVIVASSGDLGITFGWIHPHPRAGSSESPPAIPFFTIWRRDDPAQPWRYIAE